VRNGSKTVAGGGPFWPKIPHVGGVFSGTFLTSNATQVAVISGWIGSYGSMGPKGHVRHLDLVRGAMKGAQWVRKDLLRGSLLA